MANQQIIDFTVMFQHKVLLESCVQRRSSGFLKRLEEKKLSIVSNSLQESNSISAEIRDMAPA
jgi:hypothetical protein